MTEHARACAYTGCPNPAVVAYTAPVAGTPGTRQIQACGHHSVKARAWTARAGPVTEDHFGQDDEPSTLF